MFSTVALVPYKKQTLLKWKTTPAEKDIRLPVDEYSVASEVFNETELCEDEKLVNYMDSSKPNEIHEELSNDSKTETLSDFTMTDQEVTEDSTIASQDDEDTETACEANLASDSAAEPDTASVITEKSLFSNADTSTAVVITSPRSPESLLVDDSITSLECVAGSHDSGGEKILTDQASDAKGNGGTDTPQQGKRKKVNDKFMYI